VRTSELRTSEFVCERLSFIKVTQSLIY